MAHSKKTIISPIALDLGAANTGAFFAHYEAGSKIEDIQKAGKVYSLNKDSYTLLMVDRTANRHQRRGHDRRQMVKRLFKLIWEEHLKLDWDKDVQQTIGFLLNRRGNTILSEGYDDGLLREFPQEAFNKLPGSLKKDFGTRMQIADKLDEWAKESDPKEKFEQAYRAINEKASEVTNEVKRRQVIITRAEKLRKYCKQRKKYKEIEEGEKDKVKLSKLSKWILDRLKDEGIKGLDIDQLEGNNIDVVKHLNKQSPESAQTILSSIPDYSEEKKALESSIWYFNSESFKVEEQKDEGNFKPESDVWIKTHIRHLAYALYKINNELQTGGRYRSKYFEEVQAVLDEDYPELEREAEKLKDEYGKYTVAPPPKYLANFCERLKRGDFGILDIEKLANLIGHLSNLELKPLRKYFNDPSHQQNDYWCEKRLGYLFGCWIISEWRVGEKDKNKAEGKTSDYAVLKRLWNNRHTTGDWKEHSRARDSKALGKNEKRRHQNCQILKQGVIQFFLDNHPNYTIPPYQDNNNRRPPKCQSLILNVYHLNDKYPQWRDWLKELHKFPEVKNYLSGYKEELQALKSGKKRPYFSSDRTGKPEKDSGRRSMAELDARLLQFIFDRRKDSDPLKLNEIYSHAKKLKQQVRDGDDRESIDKTNAKLKEALKKSELPGKLKIKVGGADKGIFAEGSFLHLACKYYKLRQRARDGRIFIFPEYGKSKDRLRGYVDTGRFADENSLLTYCNHKPRQKRYQILYDIAGLLQISPNKLKELTHYDPNNASDEEIGKIAEWLDDATGESLKSNCERAAKEQKERRGRLKEDIRGIYSELHFDREGGVSSQTSQQVKEILKASRVTDAKGLYSFCERAKTIHIKIIEKINGKRVERLRQERNPAASVYFLAQIENILFKERSGNAKTCAVCSLDNAKRMVMQETSKNNEIHAKAQRLPAIETRMFDGAIMRIARLLGNAIAEDRWEKIRPALKSGVKVHIPIITESNKFEFEPSKEELVKKQRRDKLRKGKATKRDDEKAVNKIISSNISSKDERIKEASGGICPYCDSPLGSGGDKDHILPRSGSWKTLNDEANLIYVCENCNRNKKGDYPYFLSHLGAIYKEKTFAGCSGNDQKITKWIVGKIWDEKREDFKFGRYRSFINLSEDEKIAFRHALFLADKQKIRNAVIAAINNRNRAFVNGTQRYIAEMVARAIHKKALNERMEGSLSFDYFSFPAYGSDSDSIKGLREEYERVYKVGLRLQQTSNPCWMRLREGYEKMYKVWGEYQELKIYKKKEGQRQKDLSHFIDAQMAFMLAAYYHRDEGSLRLDISDSIPLYPYDDKGEIIGNNMYRYTRPDYKAKVSCLKRRKVYDVETHYRKKLREDPSLAAKIKPVYQIHRDSIIAEKFIPLIELESGEIRAGFGLENSVPFGKKESEKKRDQGFEYLKEFLSCPKNDDDHYPKIWLINKREAQKFLMEFGDRKANDEEKKTAEFLDELSYQTIKGEIQKELTVDNQPPPETIAKAIENWEFLIKKNNFFNKKFKVKVGNKGSIMLPVVDKWGQLYNALQLSGNSGNGDKSLQDFLSEKWGELFGKNLSLHPHQRTKNVFSLPMPASIGNIRLRRKTWEGKYIIQTVPEESLAKYGDECPHTILSRNSVPRKHITGANTLEPIERYWDEIPIQGIQKYNEENPDKKIMTAKIIYQDANRDEAQIEVKSTIGESFLPQEVAGQQPNEEIKYKVENGAKWLGRPFSLSNESSRRNIKVEKHPDRYVITFTISKSARTKYL